MILKILIIFELLFKGIQVGVLEYMEEYDSGDIQEPEVSHGIY